MDFFNLLRSAEELLFEVTMWIVLFPRTLWRSLRRPLLLAKRVDIELGQEGTRRFDDMVSPPICLLLSLALGNTLSPKGDTVEGASALGEWVAQSFYNELMFSAIFVASLPLMFSWLLLRRQDRVFNRDNVRRPFYLQAYLVSPMAVALTPAISLAMLAPSATLRWLGAGVALVVTLSYLANASRVAMKELECGPARALVLTLTAMVLAMLIGMSMVLLMVDYAALLAG